MRPPPISVGCPTTSNAFSKKYAPTRRTPNTRVSRELLSTAPDSAFAATAVSVGRSAGLERRRRPTRGTVRCPIGRLQGEGCQSRSISSPAQHSAPPGGPGGALCCAGRSRSSAGSGGAGPALHGLLGLLGLALHVLGGGPALLLYRLGGVLRSGPDLVHRLLGSRLQLVTDLLRGLLGRLEQRVLVLADRALGLLRQLPLLLRGRQQAGHQPADAEGDQAGGEGVALGLPDHRVGCLLHRRRRRRRRALHGVGGAGGRVLHRARRVGDCALRG